MPEPTPSQELEKLVWKVFAEIPSHDPKHPTVGYMERFVPLLAERIAEHELSRKQEWATSLEAEIRRHALTVFDVDDETLVPIEQVFKIIKEQSKE